MTSALTRHPFGEDWVAAYFADVDRLDPSLLLRWYVEDASFRFAGHPPVVSKAPISEMLSGSFGTIAAMHHARTGVWIDPDGGSAVWEAEVSFTRKDGTVLVLPAMSALRLKDGLVRDFRFVMDPAPIYAQNEGTETKS